MGTTTAKIAIKPGLRLIRFGCYDTRRNLPAATASKRGEDNFLTRFERAYFVSTANLQTATFARGREFSLTGYGRADMIWLAWNNGAPEGEFTALALHQRIQLTAIEAKLKDWRKGLVQAARYRHFANKSILVVPPATGEAAVQYLETFRKLSVGLWEFDPKSGRVTKHTTPRTQRALNAKAHTRAIEIIGHRLKLR